MLLMSDQKFAALGEIRSLPDELTSPLDVGYLISSF